MTNYEKVQARFANLISKMYFDYDILTDDIPISALLSLLKAHEVAQMYNSLIAKGTHDIDQFASAFSLYDCALQEETGFVIDYQITDELDKQYVRCVALFNKDCDIVADIFTTKGNEE